MDIDALRLTYLGWQGWCVESNQTRILIDPLLVDEVGRGPTGCRTDFMFAIPRRFHFEALGSVDAVYLSHEHEDHFNIPTLARLDRRIPLLVSGLLSAAGRTLLAEMGFLVDWLWSGDARVVGDLELQFFGPDHTKHHGFMDEWDAMAFLVRHLGGHGTFASNVDISIGPDLILAMELERSRGIEPVFFTSMMVEAWRAAPSSSDPDASNHHSAVKDPSRESDTDLLAWRQGTSFRPFPGEMLVLQEGILQTIAARAPFLQSLPGVKNVGPFANSDSELKEPVVGRKTFDPTLKSALEDELNRLAEYLYAGPLFRLLMSIGTEAKGCRRTFAIAFVVDPEGNEWVYEYRPLICEFAQVDVTSDQVGDYLAALLVWATDFWAVACGEIEPRVIARSMVHARADNRIPSLAWMLWSFYHPLRFPHRVLTQYRKALAAEGPTPICVFGRDAVSNR